MILKSVLKIYNELISQILHCVCLYPTPFEKLNLQSIEHLKTLHDKVGFSDHSDNLLLSKFLNYVSKVLIC